MPRKYQFIPSDLAEGRSSEVRRARHSHATREVHARRRQLRVEQHQRQIVQVQARVIEPNMDLAARMLNSHWGSLPAFPQQLSSQERLLFDYYVRVIVPFSAVQCGIFDQREGNESQIMHEWVGYSTTDRMLLEIAVLLNAARSLLWFYPNDRNLKETALQYRQRGLERVRKAVSNPKEPVSVVVVVTAFALSIDEMTARKIGTARQHLNAIMIMVEQQGGPQAMGLSALIQQMYAAHMAWRAMDDDLFLNACHGHRATAQTFLA